MTGMTKEHITAHRGGFDWGTTRIARHDDPDNVSRIGVGVVRLAANERLVQRVERETAWLLMNGVVRVTADSVSSQLSRDSLFDQSASCAHVPAGSPVDFEALRDTELMVFDCANLQAIRCPRIHSERCAQRAARTGTGGRSSVALRSDHFRSHNSPEAVELVLGEVVTFPGGWSSYPPHHHPQPEIYHYRFTQAQGYGHAELGDSVVKVMEYDTIHIPAGLDHAQCAAPGYGMYYSWVIRHLPDQPYTVPEFTAEHAWTLEAGAPFWRPRELDHDE